MPFLLRTTLGWSVRVRFGVPTMLNVAPVTLRVLDPAAALLFLPTSSD